MKKQFTRNFNLSDFLFCNFDIKNNGKKDLVIKQIMPDCPCLRFKDHKKTIAPGETLTLEAIFDTVTKNGAKTIGCEIVTNDPINPSKYIYVKAQFQEKFSLKCGFQGDWQDPNRKKKLGELHQKGVQAPQGSSSWIGQHLLCCIRDCKCSTVLLLRSPYMYR